MKQARCLTLPDFYGKAFGPAVEVVVSLLTCISFICLLAGNLVGALPSTPDVHVNPLKILTKFWCEV